MMMVMTLAACYREGLNQKCSAEASEERQQLVNDRNWTAYSTSARSPPSSARMSAIQSLVRLLAARGRTASHPRWSAITQLIATAVTVQYVVYSVVSVSGAKDDPTDHVSSITAFSELLLVLPIQGEPKTAPFFIAITLSTLN